ncbi:MAG: hypothetical protein CMJ84_03990 [Planctomycetes bacterium]|nr:hypothetical protein [Planctomycetota bacterium]
MLSSGGRVPQIHTLQYYYGDAAGALQLLHSLHHLMSLKPDVLYPGRGPIIDAPVEACADLTERLRAFCRQLNFGIDDMDPGAGFLRVSEHVLETYQSCCIWYVLLSDDGHALLFDVGYSAYVFIFQNRFGYRTRFLPNTLEVLIAEHGVKQIDAVLVTHYHDDHVIGVPYVQDHLGAEVWCLDRVAPILADPTAQNMPCLMPQALRVDRVLRDRESFEWRGVRLQAHEMPGQTDLHGGFSFEADGRKYFAIGDSSHIREGKFWHGGVIFANRVCGQNYLKVAERLLEVEPQVLLHGHARRHVDGVPRGDSPVSRADLEDYHRSASALDQTLSDLVVDHADRRCRADWVRMEPYRLHLATGDSAELSVVVENLQDETIEVQVRIVPPEGVGVEPPSLKCSVAPGKEHRSAHRIQVEAARDVAPAIICADVVLDGRPLGWIGHSQVWSSGVPR